VWEVLHPPYIYPRSNSTGHCEIYLKVRKIPISIQSRLKVYKGWMINAPTVQPTWGCIDCPPVITGDWIGSILEVVW